MNGLKKIAKNSFKGSNIHKRMIVGLIALYTFGILMLVFQESFIKTQQEDKFNTYGVWSGAFYNGNDSISKNLEKDENVLEIGRVQVFTNIGEYTEGKYSYIGTIDNAMIELGRIEFLKGTLPKNKNEVVLEESFLKSIGEEASIGSKISLKIKNNSEDDVEDVREFYLAGIIKSWNSEWKKAEYRLPTILVYNHESLNQQVQVQNDYFFRADSRNDYKASSISDILATGSEAEYIFNDYAYVLDKSASDNFFTTGSVVGIIGMFTFVVIMSLFSGIYKSQKYRFILMKGIGADSVGLLRVSVWEGFYSWRIAFPIGTLGGTIFSALTLYGARKLFGLEIIIVMNWSIILFIVLFISFVYFAGCILTAVFSMSKKLTSSYRQDNSNAQSIRLPKVKKIKKLTNFRLYSKNRIFYKSQTKLRLIILMVTVIIISINVMRFLSSYEVYRKSLDNSEIYQYSLQINDLEKGIGEAQIEQFRSIKDIIDVDAQKRLSPIKKDITVHWPGWENDRYMSTLRDNKLTIEEHKTKDYFSVDLLQVMSADNVKGMEWYSNHLNEGNIDYEKFINGEQCLLILSPYYLEGSLLSDMQYNVMTIMNRNQYGTGEKIYEYKKDNSSIRPGDKVEIVTEKGNVVMEVGGIIRDVTGWPASKLTQIALGSGNLAVGEGFLKRLMPDADLNVYSDITIKSYANADHASTDVQVDGMVNTITNSMDYSEYNYQNYRLNSEYSLNDRLTKMLQSIFLIIVVIMLFVVVMYQEVWGKIETEEKRISIFRSLGMTKRRIKWIYISEYMAEGVIAGIIGSIVSFWIEFFFWQSIYGRNDIKTMILWAMQEAKINGSIIYVLAMVFTVYLILYLLTVLRPISSMIKKIK